MSGKRVTYLLLGGLIFFSCDQIVYQDDYFITEFNATVEYGSNYKTSISENDEILWEDGDLVKMSDGNNIGNYIAATVQENKTLARFTLVSETGPQLGKQSYFAIYPATKSSISNSGIFTTIIPELQVCSPGKINTSLIPMVSVSDNPSSKIKFLNGASLMKLHITSGSIDKQIKAIKVIADKGIVGKTTIKVNGNDMDITSEKDTLMIDCNEGVPFSSNIYAVIAPGKYDFLIFEVYTTDGMVFRKKMDTPYTLKRSSICSFPIVANSFYRDLSTNDNLEQETANCYVTKVSGNCKFPIIKKGNGIRPDGTVETELNSGIVSCKTFMQEGALRYTKFFLDESKDFICFEIPEEKKAGNAVVAILNTDGNVIWSWHIWYQPNLSDIQVGNFSFMNMNLGAWDVAYSDKGNGMMYQYGRKDPMLQTFEQISAQHDEYYMSDNKQISLEESIKYPNYFFSRTNESGSNWCWDWCSSSYINLWCAGITKYGTSVSQLEVKKTMYDPCPPEYHVPSYAALKYLVDNMVTGHHSELSYFVEDLQIPLCGMRDGSTAQLSFFGTYGYLWCAMPYDTANYGYAAQFSIDPKTGENSGKSLIKGKRCHAMAIRPEKYTSK